MEIPEVSSFLKTLKYHADPATGSPAPCTKITDLLDRAFENIKNGKPLAYVDPNYKRNKHV